MVDTPTSPSAGFALARFEFETDKGNEGTKILMVEWDAAAAASGGETTGATSESGALGDWEVAWEGKTTVLPIRDSDSTSGANRRVYFLLPPGAPIPPLVSISKGSGGVTLRTKPLPAIFPEGLGTNNQETGSRGVLHTIWAKKRLQELEDEIISEMKTNGESVGLEMAAQEREWIVKHFGLSIDTSSAGAIPLSASSPMTPASPRSPIGGRLGEKLKGLKLATSPAELAAAKEGASIIHGKAHMTSLCVCSCFLQQASLAKRRRGRSHLFRPKSGMLPCHPSRPIRAGVPFPRAAWHP